MPESPMTQGDAHRFTEAIRDLTKEMRDLPEKMAEIYVRKDVLEPQLKNINKTLDDHSGYWGWVVRTVAGVILVGLVTLLFASGTFHGGS